MGTITDEIMRERLHKTKEYCAVILKAGPRKNDPGVYYGLSNMQ